MAAHEPLGNDLWGVVERHPYEALLLAAGVGYVLGGGLFTRLTVNALRMGVRLGGLPLVERQLRALVDPTPRTPFAEAR